MDCFIVDTLSLQHLYVIDVFQAGWKENLATFINELKNLQCLGLTTMGAALKHAFDVLNINRMQTGIDTYGQGRCPFYLEPSVIVVITDGGKLSSNAGIQEEVSDICFLLLSSHLSYWILTSNIVCTYWRLLAVIKT